MLIPNCNTIRTPFYVPLHHTLIELPCEISLFSFHFLEYGVTIISISGGGQLE